MRATPLLFAAVTLSVLSLATTVRAQTDVSGNQYRDYYVTAKFHSTRPDPNNPGQTILTRVIVIVDNRNGQIVGEGGWGTSDQSVSLIVQDPQTSVGLVGTSAPGQLALQVDPNLESARLVGTVTAMNYITQQPVTVAVDLAWSAMGSIARDDNGAHVHDTFPGGQIVINVNGASESRPAGASGTVSINSVNYTPLPSDPPNSDYGKMGRSRGNFHTITVTPGQ